MVGHRARILLVEDDPTLAGIMVDLLRKADYEVDGPHANVCDGVAALASRFPDGAVIDLHRQPTGTNLLEDDLATYDIPFLGGVNSPSPARPSRLALERWLLPWLGRMRH